MENELVSNSGSAVVTGQVSDVVDDSGEEAEIVSIEQDFVQFDEDFGTDLMAPETTGPETDMLEQAAEGTPFAIPQAETGGTLSLLEMADGNFGSEQEGVFSWIRDRFKPIVNAIMRRARKIIRKMVALARRLGKYRACISKIVAAIKAFKAKKFGSAIKNAFSAFRCIKRARA